MSHPIPTFDPVETEAEFETPTQCAHIGICGTGIAGQHHDSDCPKFQDLSGEVKDIETDEEWIEIW